MGQKEVLIIIPAYNEEKNIGPVLDSLTNGEIANIADVLVMNDASSDNTAALAKKKGARVVTHIYNLGYGSGLWVGYKYACRNNYKYVIQMDADGQHDVCNIKNIYDRLTKKDEDGKDVDIVLCSRYMKGSSPFEASILKKIAYALFRTIIKLGTGRRIADPTTGLWGLNKKAFGYLAEFNHFDDKYPDANMIMQMLMLGYNVAEIPAVMHARKEGVSMHSGLKPIIYMFRMSFSIMAVWLRIKLYHTDVK